MKIYKTMDYKPFNEMGLELLIGTHKGFTCSLAEFPEEEAVSIYSMESKNPGKGECQEALIVLKQKYKKVYASIPLSPKAKHLFDKYKIIYPKE